jgi:hypothetical protein
MVFLLAPKGDSPTSPLRCSMMVQPIGFQNTIPSQARRSFKPPTPNNLTLLIALPSHQIPLTLLPKVMCLSIDVPTDKSYTFVIPVPSFRAADAIRSDIKVFNSIGDYGMSFFSHLEQVAHRDVLFVLVACHV